MNQDSATLVGLGELQVLQGSSGVLACVGLGSCAGASGYDPVEKYADAAIGIPVAQAGGPYGPGLVANVPKWLLGKCFTDAQEGLTVRLSTGESGVICDPKYGAIGRPLVRIFYDRHMAPVDTPYELDLSLAHHQDRLVAQLMEE